MRLGDAMVAYWLAYADSHPGYEGLDALNAEKAGLRGALDWAYEHMWRRDVLGLARVLWTWQVRGRLKSLEGRLTEAVMKEFLHDWSEQTEAILEEINNRALLDYQAGRLEEARTGFERALAVAQQRGVSPIEELQAVNNLAALNDQTGRLEEARAEYERALALARQYYQRTEETKVLRNLGLLLGKLGKLEQGRELISQALAISERYTNVYSIGQCHQFLAWFDEDEGKRTDAVVHHYEALRCFEQVQSPDAEEVRADLRRLEGNDHQKEK